MAPNDMLLIASCGPHPPPRTRSAVPAQADCPAHLGMNAVGAAGNGLCLTAVSTHKDLILAP